MSDIDWNDYKQVIAYAKELRLLQDAHRENLLNEAEWINSFTDDFKQRSGNGSKTRELKKDLYKLLLTDTGKFERLKKVVTHV